MIGIVTQRGEHFQRFRDILGDGYETEICDFTGSMHAIDLRTGDTI